MTSSSAEKTSDARDDLMLSPGGWSTQSSFGEAVSDSFAPQPLHADLSLTGRQHLPEAVRASSTQGRRSGGFFDNFKAPYPVDNTPRPKPSVTSSSAISSSATSSSWKKTEDATRSALPRSRSSTNRPLSHYALLAASQRPMSRSKTSESISGAAQDSPRLMSLGSWSDVSVAGSSASRQSLQDHSLTWDNEFTASGRGTNDSLTWENDPFLD